MTLSVVVLAAGCSTRYRRPKQLEPLGPHGETLLDYGLHDALDAGAHRVVVVTRPELLPAFRAHFACRWGDVPVDFVLQEQPPGAQAREAWGTGHAVLASAPAVDGPFVVCNADDFYGRDAWSDIVGFVRDGAPGATGRYGVVGYPLGETLSSSGGVSRAVCEVDAHRRVSAVREWQSIQRVGGHIAGLDLRGARAVLDQALPVSMNLWGFSQDLFARLEVQWERFRDGTAGEGEGEEFLLSQAIDEQLRSGGVALHLLPGGADWFGLTHPADRAAVVARLRMLVETGVYSPRPCLDSN